MELAFLLSTKLLITENSHTGNEFTITFIEDMFIGNMVLSPNTTRKYYFSYCVTVFYKVLWNKMNVLWVIIYCFKLIFT